MLNNTDATSAVTEITSRSLPSMSMSAQPGTYGRMRAGIALLRIRIDPHANASDTGTAMAASTALSMRSWRRSRARPAPIASRSAISRRRSHPRARSRFAMFAAADASTRRAPIWIMPRIWSMPGSIMPDVNDCTNGENRSLSIGCS